MTDAALDDPRIIRVDPVTGDRTIVSDATTGIGPLLQTPRAIAAGPDGSLFVVDAAPHEPDRVLRVDPMSGDRSVISSSTVGHGLALDRVGRIAVESDGQLVAGNVVTVSGSRTSASIIRIEPVSGDRSEISGPSAGNGASLEAPRGIDVAPDGSLVIAQDHFAFFCVVLCPSEFCVYCLAQAATVVLLDPVSGERHKVSGGGTCLGQNDVCWTPYFGNTGRGRSFSRRVSDVAVEAAGTYLVVDELTRLFRVDPVTGRSRVLSHLRSAARSSFPEGFASDLESSRALHPARLYSPPDTRAWLQRALGDPELAHLLREATTAKRFSIGRRLYAALWRTMLEVRASDAATVLTQ